MSRILLPAADAAVSATLLSPDMLQAYRETFYHVQAADSGFRCTLQVGQPCPGLRALYQRFEVDCSAFLTACNPYSQWTDAATNTRLQAALALELVRRGWPFLPGLGQHPSNGWPGESSYLVLGLNLRAARQLAAQFAQNALLWSDADAVPQLILLR